MVMKAFGFMLVCVVSVTGSQILAERPGFEPGSRVFPDHSLSRPKRLSETSTAIFNLQKTEDLQQNGADPKRQKTGKRISLYG